MVKQVPHYDVINEKRKAIDIVIILLEQEHLKKTQYEQIEQCLWRKKSLKNIFAHGES